MVTEADVKVVEKVLDIAKKELSLEEYARFLSFIGPKIGDTEKELRQFRDKVSAEDFMKRLKKKGIHINP